MPLPKTFKDFDRYEHYYFIAFCRRCDRDRKHRIAVSFDDVNQREYITRKCSCGSSRDICTLKEFNDNWLQIIKYENPREKEYNRDDNYSDLVYVLERYFFYERDKTNYPITIGMAQPYEARECRYKARSVVSTGKAEDFIRSLIEEDNDSFKRAVESVQNDDLREEYRCMYD